MSGSKRYSIDGRRKQVCKSVKHYLARSNSLSLSRAFGFLLQPDAQNIDKYIAERTFFVSKALLKLHKHKLESLGSKMYLH